jgi:hypothetical protein
MSKEARNRACVRRLAFQIDLDIVDITPAPSLQWIVAFDDGMAGHLIVLPRMTTGRLIAAANVSAAPAQAQGNPMRRHSSQPSALGVTILIWLVCEQRTRSLPIYQRTG